MGRCISRYCDDSSLDLISSESFTRHELPALLGTPLVDQQLEKNLATVQEAMTVTSGYGASCIFYTDGSLIEGYVGFAVHQVGGGGLGHEILSSTGVFSAEVSTLFTALRHIVEVIRPPKRCLILTDSLSSIKAILLSRRTAHRTHTLVYECKQLCWSRCQNGIEV
jgi:hypothetical protein